MILGVSRSNGNLGSADLRFLARMAAARQSQLVP
jgi:hypothetical protein